MVLVVEMKTEGGVANRRSDLVSEAVDGTDPPELRSNFFFGSTEQPTAIKRTALHSDIFISDSIPATMGPLPKKRKLTKVEEVNFDADARHDFITGFRKRKQQRIKHAQDAAEKRAREERRQGRKKVISMHFGR